MVILLASWSKDVGILPAFTKLLIQASKERIIAGNHDLTLHEDWYPENFSRFVEEKQVCRLVSLRCFLIS